MKYLWLVLIMVCLRGGMLVSAQTINTCSHVYNQAIAAVNKSCLDIEPNSICYGNADVEVQKQNPGADLIFSSPGDQIPVSNIVSTQLAAMDTDHDRWGVVVFQLQTINLENTSPGQLVTFLAFGDTNIEKNELATEVIDDAQIVDEMRSFYLETGIGSKACIESPTDGLLIQTERGMGKVYFQINGVDIVLGSTAYIQASAGGQFRLYMIDGEAVVQVEGHRVVVTARTFIEIWMTDDSLPDSIPSIPKIYDLKILELLPLQLLAEIIDIEILEIVAEQLLDTQGFVFLPLDDELSDATYQLKVSALYPWVEIPIELFEGQTVTFEASGATARSCNHDSCPDGYDQFTTPNGISGNICGDCIVINIPEMALVGRIGDGTPFLIGTGTTITAEQDSVLYLAINDADYAYNDNEGFYQVTITIE